MKLQGIDMKIGIFDSALGAEKVSTVKSASFTALSRGIF